ncbi:MAG: hypothetical protein ABFC56_06365 [Clostridiaceae bacterium]
MWISMICLFPQRESVNRLLQEIVTTAQTAVSKGNRLRERLKRLDLLCGQIGRITIASCL